MSHNRFLKLGFVIGLLLIVGGAGCLVFQFAATRDKPVLEVNAIAHQWWWEFDYPKLGVKVKNEFYIPEGQPVRLELTSADVLHSFWLPSMKLAVDVVPGQRRTLLLTARSAGTLHGSCGVGCGCNTVCMRFRVLVTDKLEFQKWIKKQRGVSLTPGNRIVPSCVLDPTVDRARLSNAGRALAALLTQGNAQRKQAASLSSAP